MGAILIKNDELLSGVLIAATTTNAVNNQGWEPLHFENHPWPLLTRTKYYLHTFLVNETLSLEISTVHWLLVTFKKSTYAQNRSFSSALHIRKKNRTNCDVQMRSAVKTRYQCEFTKKQKVS